MKKGFAFAVAVALSAAAVPRATAGGVPFSAIRLRKAQTDSAKVWSATLVQFAKHRAGVDEVWFSTGISSPDMSEHRANAVRLASASAELRRLGIEPSLQIQATIGHGDAFTRYADNAGIRWQTYVAADGAVAESLNCPRAPGFLAYMREMAALYAAAMKPYSIWIDDDIRIVGHHAGDNQSNSGWGCHCAHCLEAFAAKEGKARTREQLVSEMQTDSALEARWRAFAFEGEAALVRAIGEAVHAVSPTTRMCQQQPGACFPEHRALYEAHHAATRAIKSTRLTASPCRSTPSGRCLSWIASARRSRRARAPSHAAPGGAFCWRRWNAFRRG